MPTARDLLEQADALMRRNRARAAEEEIPVLHDAIVPAAGELGLDLPTEGPLSVIPEAPDADVADENDVVVAEDHSTGIEPTPAGDPVDTALDDVPLLTDAVEEIEAPSIADAPPNEGEESLWLLEPGSDDATSIIPTIEAAAAPRAQGSAYRAPDIADEFIFEVPPLDEVEPEAPQSMPDADVDAQSHVSSSTDSSPAHEWPEVATTINPVQETNGPAAETERQGAALAAAVRDVEELSPNEVDEEAEPDVAEGPSDIAEVIEETAPRSHPSGTQPDAGAAMGLAEAMSRDEMSPETVPSNEPIADFSAHDDALPPASSSVQDFVPASHGTLKDAASVGDAAQWSALAEEIRMQVLQRIDLFTDTGLREQLSARLKPIVDRASNDLVATINQHVGMLLRAYVAEAIEREIEKWRESGKDG